MQALTHCEAIVMSTRTTVGQFKGQFKGAMERYTWVRFAGKLTTCHETHIATVSIPVGRWMKVQGKGRRQAHVRNRVVMDIAAFKISHSVGIDIDTTALRAKKWSA